MLLSKMSKISSLNLLVYIFLRKNNYLCEAYRLAKQTYVYHRLRGNQSFK